MLGVAAIAWIVQIVNATDHYSLTRFALRPRHVDGLWGVVTAPFLHDSYSHTFSDTVLLVAIGWVLLLSGVRSFLIVTATVALLGGILAWSLSLVPHYGRILGSNILVFGWLGYLLARAYFSRRIRWILVAVGVLFFFGALLGELLPSYDATTPWQARWCGFAAGALAGAALHPRRRSRRPPGSSKSAVS
jgi:membrane associated rhomboid family serine protease